MVFCSRIPPSSPLRGEIAFEVVVKRCAFFILFLVIVSLWIRAGRAQGGGFMIYEHSALATGMADARASLWDEVSSLWFNPAAIAGLEGFHLSLGDTLILGQSKYAPLPESERTHGRLDGSNAAEGDLSIFYPFHAYLAGRVTRWLPIGIGVNNPFGLGTAWPADWDGGFIVYRSNLRTFFVPPAAAVNLARLFSLPLDVDPLCGICANTDADCADGLGNTAHCDFDAVAPGVGRCVGSSIPSVISPYPNRLCCVRSPASPVDPCCHAETCFSNFIACP